MSEHCLQGLVKKAVAGDTASLERLLLMHYAALRAHISARLPRSIQSVVSVEDILQQAFASAFRSIGTFQLRAEHSFSAWLRKIADHRLQDEVKMLRRQKRTPGGRRAVSTAAVDGSSVGNLVELLGEETKTASQSVARRELVHAVQVAIASLPADYRKAVHLRHIEGRSLEETARVMERSEGAVRGLIQRAKKKMRAALGRSSLWLSGS